jgi:TolB-like protein/Tfp pilus assembly protein PilF
MGTVYSTRATIRFGAFEADFRSGELRKDGVKIKLQEQPLQILEVLLQHPGEVVTREELQQKIWPADTFVDFEQGLYNSVRRLRDALSDSAEKPLYIETLSRRGYRFIGTIHKSDRKIESLAVLPLENLSRDPDQEYFAEGLTEALITTLAKIGELRVASRTSAMQYKSVRKPLSQIAKELGVDAIVEGTVLRAGERVRITAQLIDAAKESHLWAESYERDLRDVLTLQSEVAQAIAREVQVKLTPQDRTHLAQVHPVHPEAYEAYLQGRYHWNRRSVAGFGKAVQCFQEAIAKDPTYAAAYSGLADCLTLIGCWGAVHPADGAGKAKTIALKALAIDSSLAEAHASLAFASMWYDYDFVNAEKEFERSLELNPRYAVGHHWFGWCLGLTGRYEESYTELQRAIRLDPQSGAIRYGLGCICLLARRYDQAIQELSRAIDLEPGSAQPPMMLATVYLYKSMPELAIPGMEKSVQLSNRASSFVAPLGEAYAAARQTDKAVAILDELLGAMKQRYVTRYFLGRLYAALGRNDEAFRCFQAGCDLHEPWMVALKTDARLDHLRSDQRFEDLLGQLNFPDP